MSSSSRGPIFITGHHRSGKTLIRWLLDSSPGIAISQRTQMWPKFYRSFGPLEVDDNLETCLEEMQARKQIFRLGVDWDQVRRDFDEGPPTYARLFRVIHDQFAQSRGAGRWGDQSTDLDRYADRIIEAYPGARIVHMLRDPRDAYADYTAKHDRRISGPGAFCAGWLDSSRRASKHSTNHSESYMVIRYEDLAKDPEATTERLFDFIQEQFDPSILELGAVHRYDDVRSRSERRWAITSEHIGAGSDLSSCQTAFIESVTESALVGWGFPQVGERAPWQTLGCLPALALNGLLYVLETSRLALRRDPPPETASSSPIMRAWHRFTDSDAFRSAVKRGWASPLFKSRWYRFADIVRRRALVKLSKSPSFDEVKAFALFIGHNKSGTSMVGALLDANRQIVMSDEANALKYVAAGVPREDLFRILLRASASEARKGRVTARRLGAYTYRVPGQWQGRVESPLVIGDSMSGTTTRLLASTPELIDDVEATVGDADLKLIHVVRNPFDPISLMVIRGKRTIENSVDHYFNACSKLAAIRERVGGERILQVFYEDFIRSPESQLERVCHYLGVDADPVYLKECAGIVDDDFEDSRNRINWPTEWIDEVQRRMKDYQFLEGYSFDSRDRASLSR